MKNRNNVRALLIGPLWYFTALPFMGESCSSGKKSLSNPAVAKTKETYKLQQSDALPEKRLVVQLEEVQQSNKLLKELLTTHVAGRHHTTYHIHHYHASSQYALPPDNLGRRSSIQLPPNPGFSGAKISANVSSPPPPSPPLSPDLNSNQSAPASAPNAPPPPQSLNSNQSAPTSAPNAPPPPQSLNSNQSVPASVPNAPPPSQSLNSNKRAQKAPNPPPPPPLKIYTCVGTHEIDPKAVGGRGDIMTQLRNGGSSGDKNKAHQLLQRNIQLIEVDD